MARRPLFKFGSAVLLLTLAPWAAAAGDGTDVDNQRLRPGIYPAFEQLSEKPAGSEVYDPFFDVDWSVALRGAYQTGTDGQRFDTVLAPDVSLTHTGTRSSIKIDANAEVQQPLTGAPLNVNALRLSLGTTYALDRDTDFVANGSLSYAKPVDDAFGLATDVVVPPSTVVGTGDVSLTRQFGKFNVGLSGGLARTLYGPTTTTGNVTVDNSEQNLWTVDGGLRVGFQATPVFEVFGVAGLGRDYFDKPSSSLMLKTDATRATLQAGIKGQWTSVLAAEFSGGVGLRRFDAASLGEVTNTLYNASITFTPDPTWIYTGAFTTTVTPPNPIEAGTTRVEYVATGRVDHEINEWMAVHALANWKSARFEGSSETETGYGWGVGGLYRLSRHTLLTADYASAHVDNSASGIEDNQTVTLGITVAR